jgi:hypothetical protein
LESARLGEIWQGARLSTRSTLYVNSDVVGAVLGLDLNFADPLSEVEHGCVGLQDPQPHARPGPQRELSLKALLERHT